MSAISGKTIPTLNELPLIGRGWDYLQDPLALFNRAASEGGPIVRYHIGPASIVQVNAPHLIGSLLVEHAQDQNKGNPRGNIFYPFIGNGLLISEGTLHQTERELLEPAFQTSFLAQYADIIVAITNRYQQSWEAGTLLDVSHEMAHLTMSIISKLVLGREINLDADELGQAYATALDWINGAILRPLHLPLNLPTQRNKSTVAALKLLKNGIRTIIQEHRKHIPEQPDILSALLTNHDQYGHGMSDEQAYDEIITIFGAGQATVATSLVWTWYLLVQNPAIYARMQYEVKSVLEERLPTAADLPRLSYTLQVYKEALRLYPPTSLLVRKALYDFNLEGYNIRSGETLLISSYVLHHLNEYFPNPNQFEPERFESIHLPPNAFLPFGAGPRMCLGQHLAPLEGQLILATLAQKITFEQAIPGSLPVPELAFSLRPKTNLKIRAVRR